MIETNTTKAILKIEFLDYWHVGSGRGSGSHLDALVEKDSDGLPFVPGRMLKGLMRDAVYRLDSWNLLIPPQTEKLFGTAGFAEGGTPREDTQPGCLSFPDARLPDDLRVWLKSNGQARQALFGEFFSTAIEHDSGTAKGRTLRGIEVVIPVTLEAEIEYINKAQPAADWEKTIGYAIPLIRAIGSNRTRGLGRCTLTMEPPCTNSN